MLLRERAAGGFCSVGGLPFGDRRILSLLLAPHHIPPPFFFPPHFVYPQSCGGMLSSGRVVVQACMSATDHETQAVRMSGLTLLRELQVWQKQCSLYLPVECVRRSRVDVPVAVSKGCYLEAAPSRVAMLAAYHLTSTVLHFSFLVHFTHICKKPPKPYVSSFV